MKVDIVVTTGERELDGELEAREYGGGVLLYIYTLCLKSLNTSKCTNMRAYLTELW